MDLAPLSCIYSNLSVCRLAGIAYNFPLPIIPPVLVKEVGNPPHTHPLLVSACCPLFTARRNARIASAVLSTSIPSVCPSVCLSGTRRYCVKTTARSTVQFALLDSKMCLVL